MAPTRSALGVRTWVVCLSLVLGGCASDGSSISTGGGTATGTPTATTPPTPATTSTSRPTTTTATTATTATTTTATTATTATTTTTVVPGGRFEPACHDRTNDRDPRVAVDDPALATLAVVGDHPALDIELPASLSESGAPLEPPRAGAVRIPGGLLVTVSAPSTGWFPGGIVAAVDLDGGVRWVRCPGDDITGPVVAPLDADPDRVLLGTSRWDGDALVSSWDIVSLADGSTVGSLDRLVADTGLDDAASADRQLILAERGVAVFGPSYARVLDTSVDGLLRLDLDTWTVSTTTVPPEFDGHPASELQLALGTDGSLLRMGQLPGSNLRVPQSVEVDGTWVTDDALRRSVWGPVVDAWYDGAPRLASWDATGTVLWENDGTFPAREGFMYGRSGDVAVTVSCAPSDGTSPCPDERLEGLDATSGRELWSLPGWRIIGPMADGIAYVTDTADVTAGGRPTAWSVLDTETGRLADAPVWAGLDTFRTGCCGESDYQHTTALGGVVVTVSGRTMHVWFPAPSTPPTTISVELV